MKRLKENAFKNLKPLPICANCKKYRNEGGEWLPIEKYLVDNGPINYLTVYVLTVFNFSIPPTAEDQTPKSNTSRGETMNLRAENNRSTKGGTMLHAILEMDQLLNPIA